MKRLILLLFLLCPILLCGQSVLSTLEVMYSVRKGETWESIAARRGVSVSDLKAANMDVKGKKLKRGTLLIIPKPAPQPPAAPPVEATHQAPIRTAISHLKVGVLLPLSEKRMLEFYRGFLMAADSVRHIGVDIDIHAWDCGETSAQVEALLPELDGLDLVIGPVSLTQVTSVAERCKELGTRLVLPFWGGQSLLDYPLLYNATAPAPLLFQTAVDKMMSFFPDKNFVIVRTGNVDNHGQSLSSAFSAELTERSLQAKSFQISGDDFAYESAFNQFRDNFILLDDSSTPSLKTLLTRLKDFKEKHPQYRLSLVGYPEWLNEADAILDDLFCFNTYIISPYFYNELDEATKRFQQTYEQTFRIRIAQNTPRYAALGFDLGHFFLTGLASMGDTFEQMGAGQNDRAYQSLFRFERTPGSLSFTNRFIQFVHYSPDKKIELIR